MSGENRGTFLDGLQGRVNSRLKVMSFKVTSTASSRDVESSWTENEIVTWHCVWQRGDECIDLISLWRCKRLAGIGSDTIYKLCHSRHTISCILLILSWVMLTTYVSFTEKFVQLSKQQKSSAICEWSCITRNLTTQNFSTATVSCTYFTKDFFDDPASSKASAWLCNNLAEQQHIQQIHIATATTWE